MESQEVTASDGVTTTVLVTTRSGEGETTRTEVWTGPGEIGVGALPDGVTRTFSAPLLRFRYPLAPGQTWDQWLRNGDPHSRARGAINRYVRVGRWEKISTPAGSFDTLRLYVITRFDDGAFWRRSTTETDTIWYAPAVRGVVKEERDAEYLLVGDSGTVRTRHAVLRLTGFASGVPVTGFDDNDAPPRTPLAFPHYADLG